MLVMPMSASSSLKDEIHKACKRRYELDNLEYYSWLVFCALKITCKLKPFLEELIYVCRLDSTSSPGLMKWFLYNCNSSTRAPIDSALNLGDLVINFARKTALKILLLLGVLYIPKISRWVCTTSASPFDLRMGGS